MQIFDWNKWIQLILRLCFHGHTIAVTALVIKQIKKNKRQSCMYWKGNWNLKSERHRHAGMWSAQVDSHWPPAFILHRNYWARAGFSKGKHEKNRTRKIWPTPTPPNARKSPNHPLPGGHANPATFLPRRKSAAEKQSNALTSQSA